MTSPCIRHAVSVAMMRLLVISFADPRDRAVEQFDRHSPRLWVRDVIVSLFYHWFNNPRRCAGRGRRSEAIGLPASRRRVAPAILLGTDFGDDRTFRPDSGGNYPIPRNEAPSNDRMAAYRLSRSI